MFDGCLSLSSLSDISKWNTNKETDMSSMFYKCSSLSSLPDISKWSTNNATDISFKFYICLSLSSLPVFQNGTLIILPIWVICFVDVRHYYLYLIFQNGINQCSSLSSLPDISEWDTYNVTEMKYLFYKYSSLSYLTDIS